MQGVFSAGAIYGVMNINGLVPRIAITLKKFIDSLADFLAIS